MVQQSIVHDPSLKKARDKFRKGLRKMDRQDGVRLAQLHREYLTAIGTFQFLNQ
jgi:hypothetical protein